MKVRYSYLPQQFSECDDLWKELKSFVATGDFTLGKPLENFEKNFASLIGVKHAIGVNSGTDAIKLSLRGLGINAGDEVITAANTFIATVGAISEIGAIPVFVDCDDTFCMNVNLIEKKITKKTRAILPVHFTGYMTDMRKVNQIAKKHNLIVVEDACQSILGSIDGRNAGRWGDAGAFSLHPLKNINVWSDGGVIVTENDNLNNKLRLLRNHGLADRDTIEILGYNSRLDTIQAVVGNWILPQAKQIADQRIKNANFLDSEFQTIEKITIPPRPINFRLVYHLYIIFAEHRDALYDYCIKNGIEVKIHYPIPLYLQKGLSHLGYKEGDFPVTDEHVKKIITFPCDQHLSNEQLQYMTNVVKKFYNEYKI